MFFSRRDPHRSIVAKAACHSPNLQEVDAVGDGVATSLFACAMAPRCEESSPKLGLGQGPSAAELSRNPTQGQL